MAAIDSATSGRFRASSSLSSYGASRDGNSSEREPSTSSMRPIASLIMLDNLRKSDNPDADMTYKAMAPNMSIRATVELL